MPSTIGVVASGYRYLTPAELSPKAWWDASDTSTITSSSGAVSQWNDKSGNGYHLTQATSSAQPTTGSVTKNGLNVLKFDGGDVMNYAGTTGMNVTSVTVLGVFEETTTADNVGFFVAHASTGNDYDRTDAIVNASVTGSHLFETVRNQGNARVSGGGATPFAVWMSIWTSSSLIARRNKLSLNTGSQTGTWGTANGGFVLGGRYLSGAVASTNRLTGNIAEMVVFDRELNSSDYDKLTDHLMSKWGIT